MTREISDCPCQQDTPVEWAQLNDKLEKIRNNCDALRKVLIPESLWEDYKRWCQEDNNAHHYPIFYLALMSGYLGKLTSPIHRFLLGNGEILPTVKKDYLKRFCENWLKPDESLKRHGKARGYLGTLIELLYAEWLQNNDYEILGLEAWGADTDVIASKSNIKYAFEIKFIGQEDEDFVFMLGALQGNNSVHLSDPCVARNYLLFRVYEAAKQLQKHRGKKLIAVIVIDSTTFEERFKIPLNDELNNDIPDENKWFRWWGKPQLRTVVDGKWNIFLKNKQCEFGRKYDVSDINSDIEPTIKGLSSIIVMEFSQGELHKFNEFINPG